MEEYCNYHEIINSGAIHSKAFNEIPVKFCKYVNKNEY